MLLAAASVKAAAGIVEALKTDVGEETFDRCSVW